MVKELERRQKVKRVVYSWPSLVLMSVISFFLVKGAINIVSIEQENAYKVEVLEAQNTALTLREVDLEEEIKRLKTDEGVVEAIKDKFSVTREGEYLAIIVDERFKATTTVEIERPWYQRFWDVIIDE